MTTAHNVPPRSKPGISTFVLVLVGIAAIAIAAVVLDDGRDRIDAVVPKRALPAYHQIATDDLETVSLDRKDLSDGYFTNAAALGGTITRQDLPAGRSIGSDSVTPVVKGDVGEVRFELEPENVAGLDFSPGDRAVLRLAPTARGGAPVSVSALLLHPPDEDSKEQTYVVAVASADVEALLGGLGRARLFITPTAESSSGPEGEQTPSSAPG